MSIFVISVICIGLCGCQEKNDTLRKDSELEKLILGSWQFVESITVKGNNITSSNATGMMIFAFYENSSMKIINYPQEQYSYPPLWVNYKIENNLLFIDYGNYTNESVKGANISFSEDGEFLFITTLSFYQYGEKNEFHIKFKKLE